MFVIIIQCLKVLQYLWKAGNDNSCSDGQMAVHGLVIDKGFQTKKGDSNMIVTVNLIVTQGSH